MPVFDMRKTRRPRDSGSGSTFGDLEELREEVPEVDSTLEDIDRVLAETTPGALAHKQQQGGCGCFGT